MSEEDDDDDDDDDGIYYECLHYYLDECGYCEICGKYCGDDEEDE